VRWATRVVRWATRVVKWATRVVRRVTRVVRRAMVFNKPYILRSKVRKRYLEVLQILFLLAN